MAVSVYIQNGYKDRQEYLKDMADEFGIPEDTVFMMANLLGPNEDFDGLVTQLEDMAEEMH